jgi:1,4-dihydroxy-2-naphthoate octaprenyltransferase
MKAPSLMKRRFLIAAFIPTILLLTLAGLILGVVIQGGQFPLEGMLLGAIGGFAFMLWATFYTVIAWQHQKWLQIKIALIAFLIIDFWWVSIVIYKNLSAHP